MGEILWYARNLYVKAIGSANDDSKAILHHENFEMPYELSSQECSVISIVKYNMSDHIIFYVCVFMFAASMSSNYVFFLRSEHVVLMLNKQMGFIDFLISSKHFRSCMMWHMFNISLNVMTIPMLNLLYACFGRGPGWRFSAASGLIVFPTCHLCFDNMIYSYAIVLSN